MNDDEPKTAADWGDFASLLDRALELSEDLDEGEYKFVTDLEERYDEYGGATFVSEAQYDWLKKIVEEKG
jgi:hypothetical protein